MKLLLDTHVVLWWLDDPTQISEVAQAAIRSTECSSPKQGSMG